MSGGEPPGGQVTFWHGVMEGAPDPFRVFSDLYAHEPFAMLYELSRPMRERGWSWIGARPALVFRSLHRTIELQSGPELQRFPGEPLEILREIVDAPEGGPELRPYAGGAMGYAALGWPTPDADPVATPDGYFLFPTEVLAFDHETRRVHLILYHGAADEDRGRELHAALDLLADERSRPPAARFEPAFEGGGKWMDACVRRMELAKSAGLSHLPIWGYRPLQCDSPLNLYSAFREQSADLDRAWFLRLDRLCLMGGSRSTYLRVDQREVMLDASDPARAGASHAANAAADATAGRLSTSPGSVASAAMGELKDLASGVELASETAVARGSLKPGRTALEAFESTYPPVVFTGAPKSAALPYIRDVRDVPWKLAGAACGYASFLGDLEMRIAEAGAVLVRPPGEAGWAGGIHAMERIGPSSDVIQVCSRLANRVSRFEAALRPEDPGSGTLTGRMSPPV